MSKGFRGFKGLNCFKGLLPCSKFRVPCSIFFLAGRFLKKYLKCLPAGRYSTHNSQYSIKCRKPSNFYRPIKISQLCIHNFLRSLDIMLSCNPVQGLRIFKFNGICHIKSCHTKMCDRILCDRFYTHNNFP